MNRLLELFNNWKHEYKLEIEIGYTPVLDWYIEIKQWNHGKYIVLFMENNCDLDKCIAKTYLFLTDWLIEHNDGY